MIYIQSNNNLPFHFDSACALYGAIESFQDYRLVTLDDVLSSKFDSLIRSNLFIGSVQFMNEVFSRVGLYNVRLPKNSNRVSSVITLGDAYVISKTRKIFIKPIDIKLFTGLVLDGFIYSCLTSLPESTLVMCYDIFKEEIESEWRVYVYRNEITDSRNYSGDFKIGPDYDYIKNIIEENRSDFPSTYTIDIGILESGENVIIEFNDMWAIGNYGIQNDIYLRLLSDRYFDIMKKV